MNKFSENNKQIKTVITAMTILKDDLDNEFDEFDEFDDDDQTLVTKELLQNNYIDEVLQDYYADDGEKTLLILELQNGERIIGITDINDPTIVELPVHIIEQQEMDEKGYSIYYRLYSYQNMADEVSELVLYQTPFLAYAPKQNIIDSYFNYWISVMNLNTTKNEENKNDKDGFSNFIISTNSLS